MSLIYALFWLIYGADLDVGYLLFFIYTDVLNIAFLKFLMWVDKKEKEDEREM